LARSAPDPPRLCKAKRTLVGDNDARRALLEAAAQRPRDTRKSAQKKSYKFVSFFIETIITHL